MLVVEWICVCSYVLNNCWGEPEQALHWHVIDFRCLFACLPYNPRLGMTCICMGRSWEWSSTRLKVQVYTVVQEYMACVCALVPSLKTRHPTRHPPMQQCWKKDNSLQQWQQDTVARQWAVACLRNFLIKLLLCVNLHLAQVWQHWSLALWIICQPVQ